MTMMLTGLLTALGLALTMLTTVETWLSAGLRTSQELSYAADAAAGRAQVDLAAAPDWTPILQTAVLSSFNDGRSSVVLSDGTAIDLASETRALQADMDARFGPLASNPDCPQWRLFAHAPADTLAAGASGSSLYLAAWVADDPSDGDGDPGVDGNGRVVIRAQAFGARGARRSVETIVGRVAPAVIRLFSWRELR
jgi:hypothetical protein